MSELRIKKIDEKSIDTILAEDIDFQGIMNFEKPLMIKGKFNGEIKADGDLIIGENAVVVAKIEADKVTVKGTIKGNIYANTAVELYSTAKVKGDILTPNLEIEKGCIFNGKCKMNPNIKKEKTFEN
jgi:cytoskeletal protein CcmA (bactofilin family)